MKKNQLRVILSRFAMTACLLALVMSLVMPAFGAEFTLDETAYLDGMSLTWYQGYSPRIEKNTMTLHLPLRAEGDAGEITVSIALDDPQVYLLSGQPEPVTVSPRNGVYPVRLEIPLSRYRRNGDFPATITIRRTNEVGTELVGTMPYVIRIRDGLAPEETMEPVISEVAGALDVGSGGSISLAIENPTRTIAMTNVVLTVTDPTGDVVTTGAQRVPVPEILPGQTAQVTIPVVVDGNAGLRQHCLQVRLSYQALGREEQWTEEFSLPVTQAVRLEQGGVQMPIALAGEMTNLTMPLMNLGRGELNNVMVKLEIPGVVDGQSVLVGTIAPGETKQAKVTFTPPLSGEGIHSGTVTIACEDGYGNLSSQTVAVELVVEAPPVTEPTDQPAAEEEKTAPGIWVLGGLCLLLTVGLAVSWKILTGKIHKLEEERL